MVKDFLEVKTACNSFISRLSEVFKTLRYVNKIAFFKYFKRKNILLIYAQLKQQTGQNLLNIKNQENIWIAAKKRFL